MSLESVKSEVLPDCCADHVVWVQVFPLVNIVHWEERQFLAKTVAPKYFSHLAQKNVQIFSCSCSYVRPSLYGLRPPYSR